MESGEPVVAAGADGRGIFEEGDESEGRLFTVSAAQHVHASLHLASGERQGDGAHARLVIDRGLGEDGDHIAPFNQFKEYVDLV